MDRPISRIAVSTGGGDAPGLNAVIRAVVLTALRRGWEVLGIAKGYEGLYDTSKIAKYWPSDRYVGAALELFASVALFFWYILRLLMARR